MASQRRRNLRPLLAIGSVLVLAGTVGGWLLWRGPAEVDAGGAAEPQLTDAGESTGAMLSVPPAVALSDSGTSEAGKNPAPAHVDPEPEPVREPVRPEVREPDPAPVLPEPPAPRVAEDYPADLQGLIRAAELKLSAKDLVTARELLNRALHSDAATETDRASLRNQIAKLNDDLVFSPTIFADDAMSEVYTVQGGDSLTRIVPRQGLSVETGFVARINRMSNPNSLRVGQKLKLIRGPFHAVVTKSAFRMDLFAGNPGEESDWVYIRSCTVGLGEGDSTPTGTFTVRRHSKLIDPPWTNPRTGERFAAKDPLNPIGNRWLGLEGMGSAAAQSGYGIHGTIDPESIGMMKSMGCIRLGQADVELVYDMLVEAISTVRIDP
jgi:LysM repeat protein